MKSNLLPIKFLVLSMLLLVTSTTHAQQQAEVELSPLEQILQQIQKLQTLVAQRLDFGVVDPSPVENEISQYFAVKQSASSENTQFGVEPAHLVFETDGGVNQLVLKQDCSADTYILAFGKSDCRSQLWILPDTDSDGVSQFNFNAILGGDMQSVGEANVFACRFNGCEQADDITIVYKETKELFDYIDIIERHNFTYEYDEKLFYVQEILLDLNEQRPTKMEMTVRCKKAGPFVGPGEADRIGCAETKRFSRSLLERGTVDEFGNVFDLKVEFVANVTKMESPESIDSVEIEFKFVDQSNSFKSFSYKLR